MNEGQTNGRRRATPVLRATGLAMTYRHGTGVVRALDQVALAVEPGELVAVMGRSGSGKTTLLRLAAGLETPSAGDVSVEGRSLAALGDDDRTILRRRRIGIVFQFFNLLPALTVEANVALPLLLDGCRFADAAARVACMLDRVGLAQRGRHRASALSGGEMQRVAIARALVIEPALLLADEPTGNLDRRTGTEMVRLIEELTRERGHATLLVTHDAEVAHRADRIVELADGRLVDPPRGP